MQKFRKSNFQKKRSKTAQPLENGRSSPRLSRAGSAPEAAKEAVWMKNYIKELGVVLSVAEPVVIFCDNNGAIAQTKEPRSHHRSKHILRRYHLLREMVSRGECRMDRVSSAENTAELTKLMSQIAHTQHLDKMGL
ncbi:UNVERIFIED_CONTAM: hypothetical protein Sradi_5223300, partial [Sesamum radiatum]